MKRKSLTDAWIKSVTLESLIKELWEVETKDITVNEQGEVCIKDTTVNEQGEVKDVHVVNRAEVYDSVVSGMVLRVTKTGHKSFALRYWYDKLSKQYTLGKYPVFSLAQARDKAKELKRMVADGEDPARVRLEKRQAKPETLKDVIEQYKAVHLPMLKESTQIDYKRRIKHILKGLGEDRYIKDIERYEILDMLNGIAKTSPTQAQRIQAIISGVFRYALDRQWVEKNIATHINLTGKHKKKKAKYQNMAYSDDQIKTLWEAFDSHNEPVGSYLKMLLITGQRAGETRLMKWSDIRDDIWTIPESNTKTGEEHFIPLPFLAIDVLEKLKPWTGESEYVFESQIKRGECIGSQQKAAQRIRKNTKIDFNLHSLRRTVTSKMAKLGVSPQVLSKILNHSKPGEGSVMTAIYNEYNYEDEKKIALENWSLELQRLLSEKEEEARVYKMK